jgi:hypothetical protein
MPGAVLTTWLRTSVTTSCETCKWHSIHKGPQDQTETAEAIRDHE